MPFVKSWDYRYRDKGLTVIGVHSPEFDDERKIEHLRREVASLGIRYPVVTDNDYQTWNAYKVEAWSTVFLLDKQGRIRWMHVGEGDYDEAERLIQKLLAENGSLKTRVIALSKGTRGNAKEALARKLGAHYYIDSVATVAIVGAGVVLARWGGRKTNQQQRNVSVVRTGTQKIMNPYSMHDLIIIGASQVAYANLMQLFRQDH